LIDLETHEAVLTWILQRLADAGLVKGKPWASTRPRWKRMGRCAASCGATRAKVIATSSPSSRRPRGSKRRRAPIWRGSIGSG
jgi:hypothetical protein